MVRTNHGASDQPAREKMWKYPQRQTNKDGRSRILLQPNVGEASDVESQAALRRGVTAEQHTQSRNQRRFQKWERNRSLTRLSNHFKLSNKWEKVLYRQKKKLVKPSQSQPIRLEGRYDILRKGSELDELRSYENMQCSQPNNITHHGMYKSYNSSNCGVMSKQRNDEARGKPNRGGKGRLTRGRESKRHGERE